MKEAVRNQVSIIFGTLAALSEEDRKEAINHVINVEYGGVAALAEEVEKWKKHNYQRMEEVWKARELLKAKPNETLITAIERDRLELVNRVVDEMKMP